MDKPMLHVPLAEIRRGGHVESVHYGSAVVANARGEVILSIGDADFMTFTRSCLKPFQAMPFVGAGGPAHFGFGQREVALMCASHSGEPMHTHLAQSILARAGCDEHHLQCGCHVPYFYATLNHQPPAGEVYSQLYNNCSGKHAGFLAYCVHHGLPLETYLDPGHPLQQAILGSVMHFSSASGELPAGIDGCTAPNFAMPLAQLATAYARLASDARDSIYGDAPREIFSAMTTRPDLVSGTGRFDDDLMRSRPGDLLAKGGAEGVQAIGIRSAGLGIAVKVVDGNSRGLQPAVLALLRSLKLISQDTPLLRHWLNPVIKNARGLTVGGVLATDPVMRETGHAVSQ